MKDKLLSVKVNSLLWGILEAEAKAQGMTVSSLTRQILETYVAIRKADPLEHPWFSPKASQGHQEGK